MSFGVDYHSNSHHSNQHIISSFFENIIDGNHNVSKQLFKAVIPYTIFFKRRESKNNVGLFFYFFIMWHGTCTYTVAKKKTFMWKVMNVLWLSLAFVVEYDTNMKI